jgi:hypothetical protein
VTSNRVRATQELRRSNAAAPHVDTTTRSAAREAAIAADACGGAPDLCGAPAGQPCEPWCPSHAAEPDTCAALIYAATLIDPADYCPEDAEPGSEYCALHAHLDESWADPDEER